MKHYHIHREGGEYDMGEVTVTVVEGDTKGIAVHEYKLPLEPSLEVYNHSPTGFEFGYGGSGPAQLALAILLDFEGVAPDPACYQAFKFFFIAPMEHPGGVISGKAIQKFLDNWEIEQKGIYQG